MEPPPIFGRSPCHLTARKSPRQDIKRTFGSHKMAVRILTAIGKVMSEIGLPSLLQATEPSCMRSKWMETSIPRSIANFDSNCQIVFNMCVLLRYSIHIVQITQYFNCHYIFPGSRECLMVE